MENVENLLRSVLNDPEKLSEVMELAKGLGFPPPQEHEGAASDSAGEIPLAGIMQLLQQNSFSDGRQDALMQALMPYLQPHRQQKLQKAMKLGKLSQLAVVALKNYQDQ